MAQGYARIKIMSGGIRVRFEQVGNEFDQLRDAFYRSIPTAKVESRRKMAGGSCH